MGRKPTIGDRFKSGDGEVTWELTGDVWTCVESSDKHHKQGDTVKYSGRNPHEDSYWTYLGNFSKTNKFEELYNLMNE